MKGTRVGPVRVSIFSSIEDLLEDVEQGSNMNRIGCQSTQEAMQGVGMLVRAVGEKDGAEKHNYSWMYLARDCPQVFC